MGHWWMPAKQSVSPCSRKKVHHAAQARTQADTHTPGRVAMWRTRACARRPFADFETMVLMIFARFSASRRLKYNARLGVRLGVLILQNDGVPELTQNNMYRLHVTQIRSRCPTRRTARAREHFCSSHDSTSLEQQYLRSRFFSHVGESDRATRVGRGYGRLGLGRARSFDASLRQSSNWC